MNFPPHDAIKSKHLRRGKKKIPSRGTLNLHFPDCVYISAMLANPENLRETEQITRLEELLPRWRDVPLYHDLFARANCRRADFDCFRRMPLMAKPEMRNNFPQNFLPAGQSLENLLEQNLIELEYTSGTSSERLPVIFARGWWNAQEERALRLNGFVAKILDEFPAARRATITSPACNGLTCPTVWASREQRTFGNSLFVNLARIPFVISEAELLHMAAEVAGWSPQFLDVDPVHGVRFALYCEQHGLKFPSLKFILCSYEFVSVVHKKILSRVFGVPVLNLYGSTETGHLLMENERGEMKPSCDTAFLEIVDAGAHGVGELVVTTLSNDYMPLLRYRIGDLVKNNSTPHGNHFTVQGRARDALTARDGGRITTWQVDQCFAEVNGIAHYELRQSETGECVLRFVPDGNGPTQENLRAATSQLETLLQLSGELETEAMPVLVPTASGKFRLTCASPRMRPLKLKIQT